MSENGSSMSLRSSIDYVDIALMGAAVIFGILCATLPGLREAGYFPRSGALIVLAGILIEFRWMHQTLGLIRQKFADLGEELDATHAMLPSGKGGAKPSRLRFKAKRIEFDRRDNDHALIELFLKGYGAVPLILIIAGTAIWGFGDLIA